MIKAFYRGEKSEKKGIFLKNSVADCQKNCNLKGAFGQLPFDNQVAEKETLKGISPKGKEKKRIKRAVGKVELRQFKIVLRPITLSPAENKARMEQLYRLLFSSKSQKELGSALKKKRKK